MDLDEDLTADDRYLVMRKAVQDGMWTVLGTLVAAFLLFCVFIVGALFLTASYIFFQSWPTASVISIAALVVGLFATIGSAVQLLRLFGVSPSRSVPWANGRGDH